MEKWLLRSVMSLTPGGTFFSWIDVFPPVCWGSGGRVWRRFGPRRLKSKFCLSVTPTLVWKWKYSFNKVNSLLIKVILEANGICSFMSMMNNLLLLFIAINHCGPYKVVIGVKVMIHVRSLVSKMWSCTSHNVNKFSLVIKASSHWISTHTSHHCKNKTQISLTTKTSL